MPKWKYVTCCALFIYCVGVIFFALYPTDMIDWVEWVVVGLAVAGCLGLLAYATPALNLPYEEYAYLVVGWVGFSALLLYLVDTDDPSLLRTGILLFLLSGSTAAYGAFLAQDEIEGP